MKPFNCVQTNKLRLVLKLLPTAYSFTGHMFNIYINIYIYIYIYIYIIIYNLIINIYIYIYIYIY